MDVAGKHRDEEDRQRLADALALAGLGAFTFRAKSRWQDGTHNVGEIGAFTHAGGEVQSRAAACVLLAFCYPVGLAATLANAVAVETRLDVI